MHLNGGVFSNNVFFRILETEQTINFRRNGKIAHLFRHLSVKFIPLGVATGAEQTTNFRRNGRVTYLFRRLNVKFIFSGVAANAEQTTNFRRASTIVQLAIHAF